MRLVGVVLLFTAGVFTVLTSATAQPEEPCGEAMLGFSLRNVESSTPFDGVLGGPRGDGKVTLGAEEGKKTKARAFASIVTRIEGEYFRSVQGWALSLAFEGDAVPVGASFKRSAAVRHWRSGFDATHIVDPGANEGMRGVVSHVVLGFHITGHLPGVGTTSVLELEIEEDDAHGTSDTAALIRFRDGLKPPPSLLPVSNGIVLRGKYTAPCNEDTASLELVFSLAGPRFLRGDTSKDGMLALSDAVFLLRGLFEEPRVDACPAASDANADGRVDIADAVYTLAYLFQGGRSPPAPFPDCAPDPAGDGASLPCLELPPGCR